MSFNGGLGRLFLSVPFDNLCRFTSIHEFILYRIYKLLLEIEELGWWIRCPGISQCLVVDLEGCSYIHKKSYIHRKCFFEKVSTFKVCLEQTAPPKMTAMTIGRFHVFGDKIDLPGFQR